MLKRILGWIFIIFFLITGGDSSAEPFKTTYISGRLLININDNEFHQYWNPRTGFCLQASSEFYTGRLELGAFFNKNRAVNNDQPDFVSMYTYLGWGIKNNIAKSISNYTGLRFGNYFMDFDDPQIDTELKSEHELGMGLVTALQYDYNEKFSFNVGIEHLKIFTNKRIYLWFVSTGVTYNFETPHWLKEFLQ